jgi:hypothetical protein
MAIETHGSFSRRLGATEENQRDREVSKSDHGGFLVPTALVPSHTLEQFTALIDVSPDPVPADTAVPELQHPESARPGWPRASVFNKNIFLSSIFLSILMSWLRPKIAPGLDRSNAATFLADDGGRREVRRPGGII